MKDEIGSADRLDQFRKEIPHHGWSNKVSLPRPDAIRANVIAWIDVTPSETARRLGESSQLDGKKLAQDDLWLEIAYERTDRR